MKFGECASLLLRQNDILIITHKNPDGDTVGSAGALCSALRRAGKRAYIYHNPQLSQRFLPYIGEFLAPEQSEEYFAYYVTVDVATEGLFPRGFSGKADLCIDHHELNSHYAGKELIRAGSSSCGELILKIIKAMGFAPNKQEATLLYMAVSTDTGCFQYLNTNASTLSTAAELVTIGADNARVNTDFFRKVPAARLKLEGEIYSNLSFHRGGKVTVATVTNEMFRRLGIAEEDCDDIASLAGRAEGSIVSVTIRERENGECRVSVRSGPEVSSSEICAVFGGGGHAMAAGCTVPASPEKTKTMLLAVIDEIMQ